MAFSLHDFIFRLIGAAGFKIMAEDCAIGRRGIISYGFLPLAFP
jgi:hypothetical protein